MPNLITAKIDVRKLDKARFFEGKADAQGHKPLYADIVLIPRGNREIRGYAHCQTVEEERRDGGNADHRECD